MSSHVFAGKYCLFTPVRCALLDHLKVQFSTMFSDGQSVFLQAALDLTEEQQADLMLLRRLFYGKLGALRRERKALLQQVPTGATENAPDFSDRLASIMTAAQQLHDNSAAEFKAFMQLTAAYRRGVGTHRPAGLPITHPLTHPLARSLAQSLTIAHSASDHIGCIGALLQWKLVLTICTLP